MDIPHSQTDIDTGWLSEALRQSDTIGANAIKKLECVPLENGKGYYGQIVRIQLAYDRTETSLPCAIIAKLSSSNPKMRHRPNTKRSYQREIHFYRHIAKESPLSVPKCYYSDIDMESGWHVLLLENLAPARSGSRTEGCTTIQAQNAIHHIARFHAHWWENPQLDDFDWLAGTSQTPDNAQIARNHDTWWPIFVEKVGTPLPGEVMEIGERLGGHKGWLSRHMSSAPITLRHGDYHLENLLFDAGRDETFFVVDWHFMNRGRGITDVGRFLGEMMPADRRALEFDLLREYVRILADHGVQSYSFDEAIYDYRIFLTGWFGSMVSSIAAMPFTKKQKTVIAEVLLPRNISAILDHNCLSLLSEAECR